MIEFVRAAFITLSWLNLIILYSNLSNDQFQLNHRQVRQLPLKETRLKGEYNRNQALHQRQTLTQANL